MAQCLPLTTDALERLIHQLQANFATALKFEPRTNSARRLTKLGQLGSATAFHASGATPASAVWTRAAHNRAVRGLTLSTF